MSSLSTSNYSAAAEEKLITTMLQKQSSPMPRIFYRECLRNHAARIGSNVTDGCGEFMPSSDNGTLEALKCAACSCHRNFYRKEQLATKKRHRTKFTVEQKEKMLEFAEKVGWRIPKKNDAELQSFCGEVGVKRHVFKVWMHNNNNKITNGAAKKPPQQQDQM